MPVKQAVQYHAAQGSDRAIAGHRSPPQRGQAIVDHRDAAVAQRRLVDSIAASPRVAAQRRLVDFIPTSPGVVAQRAQVEVGVTPNGSPRRPAQGRLSPASAPPSPPLAASASEAVVQRLENHDGWNWSENDAFATDGGTSVGAAAGELPALVGVTWSANGNVSYDKEGEGEDDDDDGERVTLPLYRPRLTEGNALVGVPKDCITTAELVAAWLAGQDPEVVGQVLVAPTIAEADDDTEVEPGDILFHTHSDNDGDFHGAAVIATDGDDAVTMEGDASQGNIGQMYPMFDMYEGHAGFRGSQLQEETDEHSHDDECTYVIKFAEPAGRDAATTLWRGIQDEIDAHRYTAAGATAARDIKNMIQAHIAAMDETEDVD